MLQAEAAAEAAAVAHVGGDPAETPANRLAFANDDAAMFRGKRETSRTSPPRSRARRQLLAADDADDATLCAQLRRRSPRNSADAEADRRRSAAFGARAGRLVGQPTGHTPAMAHAEERGAANRAAARGGRRCRLLRRHRRQRGLRVGRPPHRDGELHDRRRARRGQLLADHGGDDARDAGAVRAQGGRQGQGEAEQEDDGRARREVGAPPRRAPVDHQALPHVPGPRRALPRARAGRRRRAVGDHPPPRPLLQLGVVLHRAAPRGAAVPPRPRHRPPRPQARERHAHARRPRQAHRLRHRQADRPAAAALRRRLGRQVQGVCGDARVHGARDDQQRGRRLPRRPVVPRLRRHTAPRRLAAVQGCARAPRMRCRATSRDTTTPRFHTPNLPTTQAAPSTSRFSASSPGGTSCRPASRPPPPTSSPASWC